MLRRESGTTSAALTKHAEAATVRDAVRPSETLDRVLLSPHMGAEVSRARE